jgi:hypothetical protein
VLVISDHPSAIVFLEESEADTSHAAFIQYPCYRTSLFLTSENLDKYPEWSWDATSRKFLRTRSELLDEELRAKSRLAVAKCDGISKIIFDLNFARAKLMRGVDFQETVYMEKRMQAQTLMGLECDDELAIDYPYILQHADCRAVSLQEAVDAVLHAARGDDRLLERTELLRLKYFSRIKHMRDCGVLGEILDAFKEECHANALS